MEGPARASTGGVGAVYFANAGGACTTGSKRTSGLAMTNLLPNIRRRTLLQLAAGAAAAHIGGRSAFAQEGPQEEAAGLGAEDVAAPTKGGKDETFVRFLLREADDSPLAPERMKLLYARDLANDPPPQTVVDAEGRARVALAKEPIQAVCRLKVPDFGEVYCYADNGGKGFTKVENVEFVVDAAATRLRRVRDTMTQTKSL